MSALSMEAPEVRGMPTALQGKWGCEKPFRADGGSRLAPGIMALETFSEEV